MAQDDRRKSSVMKQNSRKGLEKNVLALGLDGLWWLQNFLQSRYVTQAGPPWTNQNSHRSNINKTQILDTMLELIPGSLHGHHETSINILKVETLLVFINCSLRARLITEKFVIIQ